MGFFIRNTDFFMDIFVQKHLKKMLLGGLLLTGFLPHSSVRAQPGTDEWQKRLEKLQKNPLIRRLLEEKRGPGLTEAQKKILERAVKAMSDAEVEKHLKEFGLSVDGSVYRKRERLKIALGIEAPPELPQKKGIPSMAIENASEGEYMQGEDKRGLLKLRGRIRVRLPAGELQADLIIVDTVRKEIYAEGNIVFNSRDSRIRAERMIFNQELGIGILYNAEGYGKPLYFIGKNLMQVGPQKFAVSHAFFTTCARERPHYNFSARKVWIHEGRRIIAVGVLYHVGGVPLFPLPFLYASEWGTGIITQAGWSRFQGFFLQNTYQFSVPSASFSDWMPTSYRFKLDYFQYTGESGGVDLFKFSPAVNYAVQLGAARYRRYDIIADYREKDAVRPTNRVQHADGTYGKENYQWYKAFALFNFKKSEPAKNHVRTTHVRYEYYTNWLYEYEFGGRYVPTSTIPALYENSEAGRGLVRPFTNWNMIYNEQWDDLSVRVEATRNRMWQQNADIRDSRYIKVNDVIPSADVTKNILLGRLPNSSPVYWNHALHTDMRQIYSLGKTFQTINTNQYETDFRSFFSFYPYITLRPLVGAGARKVSPQQDDLTLQREAQKNSYQYAYTADELTIGPDFLFLRALYRKKESFKEELRDAPTVNLKGYERKQKANETEVSLETYPVRNLHMSVTSIYDHLKYEKMQDPVAYRQRWFYPVGRLSYLIDFLNFNRPERENLMNRQKLHFLQLRISDDYVYDFNLQRDHSNVLGLNFQAGGFDLWLLKRLRYLELGYYWYHVYYNQQLDHMRFSAKMDVHLFKYVYFEMELESRATNIERYDPETRNLYGKDEYGRSDYIAFEHDVINSTGVNGQSKRQSSVFNIGFFECAVILDLHEWEMRFGYSIEQKSVLAGINSLDVVNFYDNKFFFSMTLLRFDIAGTSDRPSRFILNRQRVRAFDLGRTSIQSSRVN